MRMRNLLVFLLAGAMALCMAGCAPDDSATPAGSLSAGTEAAADISADAETVPEYEYEEWTMDDIGALGDIISGMGGLAIEMPCTADDIAGMIGFDGGIIESVSVCDDSGVDYDAPGDYQVVLEVVFGREALLEYLSDSGIDIAVCEGLDASDAEYVAVRVTDTVTITEAGDGSETEEAETDGQDVKTASASGTDTGKNDASSSAAKDSSSASKNASSSSSSTATSSGASKSGSSGTSSTGSSSTAKSSSSSSGNSSTSGSSSGSSSSSSASGSSSSSSSSSSTSSSSNKSSSSSSSGSSSGSSGSTSSTHTHSYTSKVTKEATCTSDGVRTYTCSCGASYTEAIRAEGHSWVAVTSEVYHAEEGHYEYTTIRGVTCNVCGKWYSSSQEYKNSDCWVDHGAYTTSTTYEQTYVVDKNAYTETVTTGYKCSKCGATK